MSETVSTPMPSSMSTDAMSVDTNSVDTSNVENTEVLETTDESTDSSEEQRKVEAAIKKKLKLKVDGEEFEEEYDPNDEDRIRRAFQMEKAANKRMAEKAQIEKDMIQLLEILKNDPDSVLAELGHDLDARAKNRLQKKLEELEKSPEQKEKERVEAELKAAREEAEKLKKEKEEADFLRMQEKYRQQFDKDLDDALSSDPDLPKNAYVIKRITDLMIFAMENKMPNVKVKDIVPIVKQEIYNEWQQMFDNFSEDQLEKAWGKKNIDRVRKALLKKQRQVAPTAQTITQPTGNSEKAQENQKVEKLKAKDFFKKLGSV